MGSPGFPFVSFVNRYKIGHVVYCRLAIVSRYIELLRWIVVSYSTIYMLISYITCSWTIPVYYIVHGLTLLFVTNTSVSHSTRNTTVTAHVVYIIKCTELMLQLGTLIKCSCCTITIQEWGTQLQGRTWNSMSVCTPFLYSQIFD